MGIPFTDGRLTLFFISMAMSQIPMKCPSQSAFFFSKVSISWLCGGCPLNISPFRGRGATAKNWQRYLLLAQRIPHCYVRSSKFLTNAETALSIHVDVNWYAKTKLRFQWRPSDRGNSHTKVWGKIGLVPYTCFIDSSLNWFIIKHLYTSLWD